MHQHTLCRKHFNWQRTWHFHDASMYFVECNILQHVRNLCLTPYYMLLNNVSIMITESYNDAHVYIVFICVNTTHMCLRTNSCTTKRKSKRNNIEQSMSGHMREEKPSIPSAASTQVERMTHDNYLQRIAQQIFHRNTVGFRLAYGGLNTHTYIYIYIHTHTTDVLPQATVGEWLPTISVSW